MSRIQVIGDSRRRGRAGGRAVRSAVEPLETRRLLTALVFTQQPTATTVGSAVAPAIVVSDEDAGGHIVGSENSIVTLSIASGPAGATLEGDVAVPAAYGIATFPNLILPAAGSYTLTATAADGAPTPVTSSPFVISDVGNRYSTTITLASSNTSPVIGGGAVYTATVHKAATGTPTGVVQFFDNGGSLGSEPLQADGTATFAASNLGSGAHAITAWYEGDSSFTASNSQPMLETVGAVTTMDGPSLVASVDGTGGAPFVFVPGDAGKVDVTIRNYGAGLAAGNVGIQLIATTDGNPADGIVLPGKTTSTKVHLWGGYSRTIPVSVTIPATLPVGNYSLMAVLTPVSGITRSAVNDSVPARTSAAARVVLAFGNVGGQQGTALTRTEPDGTLVIYRLSGPGTGTLSGDGVTNPTVTLTGTTAGTVVTITTRGGSNGITLGGIACNGSVGAINAPTSALAGTLDVQGAVGRLTLGSLSASNLAAVSFGSVLIEGSVDSSKLLAGTHLGPDGRLGGGDDTYAAGRIGSIRIGGNVTASILAAGLNPVDGVYLNGNDTLIPGSRIGRVQIGGALSDDSRILAAALPRTALISRAAVATATDPRFAL